MQVHQSKLSLSRSLSLSLSGRILSSFHEAGCLDPVFRLVVVHGLFPLSQERIHALVCAQEPVHTHDGLERQDAETHKRQRWAFVFTQPKWFFLFLILREFTASIDRIRIL